MTTGFPEDDFGDDDDDWDEIDDWEGEDWDEDFWYSGIEGVLKLYNGI